MTYTPPSKSVADEVLKLKHLLDEGVISQEEFDAQKSKLFFKDTSKTEVEISGMTGKSFPVTKWNTFSKVIAYLVFLGFLIGFLVENL